MPPEHNSESYRQLLVAKHSGGRIGNMSDRRVVRLNRLIGGISNRRLQDSRLYPRDIGQWRGPRPSESLCLRRGLLQERETSHNAWELALLLADPDGRASDLHRQVYHKNTTPSANIPAELSESIHHRATMEYERLVRVNSPIYNVPGFWMKVMENGGFGKTGFPARSRIKLVPDISEFRGGIHLPDSTVSAVHATTGRHSLTTMSSIHVEDLDKALGSVGGDVTRLSQGFCCGAMDLDGHYPSNMFYHEGRNTQVGEEIWNSFGFSVETTRPMEGKSGERENVGLFYHVVEKRRLDGTVIGVEAHINSASGDAASGSMDEYFRHFSLAPVTAENVDVISTAATRLSLDEAAHIGRTISGLVVPTLKLDVIDAPPLATPEEIDRRLEAAKDWFDHKPDSDGVHRTPLERGFTLDLEICGFKAEDIEKDFSGARDRVRGMMMGYMQRSFCEGVAREEGLREAAAERSARVVERAPDI